MAEHQGLVRQASGFLGQAFVATGLSRSDALLRASELLSQFFRQRLDRIQTQARRLVQARTGCRSHLSRASCLTHLGLFIICRSFRRLVRVALPCCVETWVSLSEFLLAGRHSYEGCALIGRWIHCDVLETRRFAFFLELLQDSQWDFSMGANSQHRVWCSYFSQL